MAGNFPRFNVGESVFLATDKRSLKDFVKNTVVEIVAVETHLPYAQCSRGLSNAVSDAEHRFQSTFYVVKAFFTINYYEFKEVPPSRFKIHHNLLTQDPGAGVRASTIDNGFLGRGASAVAYLRQQVTIPHHSNPIGLTAGTPIELMSNAMTMKGGPAHWSRVREVVYAFNYGEAKEKQEWVTLDCLVHGSELSRVAVD